MSRNHVIFHACGFQAYSSDAAKKAGEDAAKAVWDEWKTAEDAKAAAVAKAAADKAAAEKAAADKAAAEAKAKKDAGAKAGADVAKTTSGSVENTLAFGAVVVAALAVVRERDVQNDSIKIIICYI